MNYNCYLKNWIHSNAIYLNYSQCVIQKLYRKKPIRFIGSNRCLYLFTSSSFGKKIKQYIYQINQSLYKIYKYVFLLRIYFLRLRFASLRAMSTRRNRVDAVFVLVNKTNGQVSLWSIRDHYAVITLQSHVNNSTNYEKHLTSNL